MRRVLLILMAVSPLGAHRLDEYLQATLISVDGDRATLEVNLIPGANIADRMLGMIDGNGDGQVSAGEQAAYANRVTGDLRLAGASLTLDEYQFPALEDVRAGVGVIRLRLRAELPPMTHGQRDLHFENQHLPQPSVYQVNALVPPPGTSITAQRRDENQTEITISYSGGDPKSAFAEHWVWAGLIGAGVLRWLTKLARSAA